MHRQPLREALAARALLADGAAAALLYAKGFYVNQCFEAVNQSNPHVVKSIHLDFLQAGAEVLTTNTFGANRRKLAKHGLGDKVSEINRAGVRVAREAAQDGAWIAGVVGPPGADAEGDPAVLPEAELRALVAEQAAALAEAGVDAIFLDSFAHLPTLAIAAEEARKAAPDRVVGAFAQIEADGRTRFGDDAAAVARALAACEADLVGLCDGPGAGALLDAYRAMRPHLGGKAVGLRPGAGPPARHEDLTLNLATPEFFMEKLRQAIDHGARLVGGHCGVAPDHIRAIRGSLRMRGQAAGQVEVADRAAPSQRPAPAETPSRMAEKLRAGRFTVSIEIDPPVGTDATASLDRARACRDAGVDCINIADGPRATARMGPVDMAMLLQREAPGVEPIVHFCCRDRNILGMQADLIGANALGVHNILMITGDPPKLGDYPFATAVYDVDAIGALRIGSRLNNGEDLAGNPLKGDPTRLFLGCGANPGAIDLDQEVERLAAKIEAGAEYILTQPVYDEELFLRFHERVEALGVPVLIGILPLASFRNAEFLTKEVPGMEVPPPILARMKAAPDKDAARAVGIEIAREALAAALPRVQGVYIMPPFNRVDAALEVLEVVPPERWRRTGAPA